MTTVVAMEETSLGEVPNEITPEVNLTEVEKSNMSQNDTKELFSVYKKEMLESGLKLSDLEYLEIAYKNLEDVKFIRIHCTSCDRHIGSAPNDVSNRFEHPLLKVLVCLYCFDFYSSGDFEKDEDGSELYCRWCGEGGQVFCCINCPFVFCKNCINRNLGRGITKVIQNTDWLCFACDTGQIARHRATFWAIQKYSQEMIRKAELIGNTDMLSIDENICCSGATKKRVDVYSKLLQPPVKRMKTERKQDDDEEWLPPCVSEEPEDEVICTPDIIPMDDESRSNSPVLNPPPLVPFVQNVQRSRKVKQPQIVSSLQKVVTPVIVCPTGQSAVNVPHLQKSIQAAYQNQFLISPAYRIQNSLQKPIQLNPIVIKKQKLILPKTKYSPLASSRLRNETSSSTSFQNKNRINYQKQENGKDWFEQAIEDYAELSSFVSTKISSLSAMHKVAFSSEKMMTDLHRKLQSYIFTALEKLRNFRKAVNKNFEKDMERKFRNKIINPFATKQNKINEKSNDSSTNSSQKPKTKLVMSNNLPTEEILLDMDVTNASDEETENEKKETIIEEDSDDDVIEIITKQEIISISDSEDEAESKPSNSFIPDNLLEKIKEKYHLNLSLTELHKCLSAITFVKNNKLETEKINKTVTNNTDLGHIKNDLISVINELLELRSDQSNDSISGVEYISNEEEVLETRENKRNGDNSKHKENANLKEFTEEKISEKTNGEETEERKSDKKQTGENINKENRKIVSENDKVGDKKYTVLENETTFEENGKHQDIPEDIEEILSGNILVRKNKNVKKFSDEFSKFVSDKAVYKEKENDKEEECTNETTEKVEKLSEKSPKTFKNYKNITLDIDRELDIIGTKYVEDIYKDNGSLSLPPNNISGLSFTEEEILFKRVEDKSKNNSEPCLSDKNSDILMSSGVLALKQMAENCVNSVEVSNSNKECKV